MTDVYNNISAIARDYADILSSLGFEYSEVYEAEFAKLLVNYVVAGIQDVKNSPGTNITDADYQRLVAKIREIFLDNP